MKNKEIAKIFNRMADILEFKGDISFRINSYRRAARVIDDMTEDIAKIAEEGRLKEIEGIGEGLSKKIEEYLAAGKMTKYEEIRKDVSDGLIDLLGISGLGPKTVALVHKELGVKFAIGTDTHHREQLWMMRLGVGVAQRGWLEKSDVVNCWPLKKLMEHLNKI